MMPLLFDYFSGPPMLLTSEPCIAATQCGWTALPFLFVAACLPPLPRPRLAAAIGMAISGAFWLAMAHDAWTAQNRHPSGGANIGLYMLSVPLPVVVVVAIAMAGGRRQTVSR